MTPTNARDIEKTLQIDFRLLVDAIEIEDLAAAYAAYRRLVAMGARYQPGLQTHPGPQAEDGLTRIGALLAAADLPAAQRLLASLQDRALRIVRLAQAARRSGASAIDRRF